MTKNQQIEQTALLLSEDDDELLDSTSNHGFNSKPKSASVTTLKSVNPSELSNNSNSKLNRVHNQINDVIDGMKTNLNKVLERGQQLDDMDERSQQLSASANLFQTRAKSTRKAMWLRTCRARLYLGGTIAVILMLLMFFVYRMIKS